MGMPLAMATPGQKSVISDIAGKVEVRHRLAELGFVVGEKVSVINEVSGSLIVQIKDARIALDRAMANRIIVE